MKKLIKLVGYLIKKKDNGTSFFMRNHQFRHIWNVLEVMRATIFWNGTTIWNSLETIGNLEIIIIIIIIISSSKKNININVNNLDNR